MDLEHHQLILRYEHLRIRRPERERRLLASLAEHGQQIPIVVIASEEADRFVVVDGYKRIRAMRRLGSDGVRAVCWEADEVDAVLLGRLMRNGPEETAFEQGLWIQELHVRFGLALEELARRFDRSSSWVSRRLALVRDLPHEVQQRVLRGELVAHAAMKYVVPLARANREAAVHFAAAIADKGLSTRQIGELYAGYRSRSPKTRELVLRDPLLFLRARGASPKDPALPVAPGDALLRDLDMIGSIARRTLRRLCEGKALGLTPSEWDEVERCFDQARHDVERVGRQMGKEKKDAGSIAADGDSRAAPAGSGQADDRPGAGCLAGHGTPGDRLGLGAGAATGACLPGRGASGEDSRAERDLRGQPGAGA
jgi:ParB/RepB/Spo0J family partition protein